MTINEKIFAEVDQLTDEQLEEFLILRQRYEATKPKQTVSFLERLS